MSRLKRFSQPTSAALRVRLVSDQPHLFGRKLLRKRTIASGGSHASVGKPQRKRQKSPQVTDLRLDRHVASAVVSPAVSRVSGAAVSGRTHQSDRCDRGRPTAFAPGGRFGESRRSLRRRRKGPHYIEIESALRLIRFVVSDRLSRGPKTCCTANVRRAPR
jgi:hypothetical protein